MKYTSLMRYAFLLLCLMLIALPLGADTLIGPRETPPQYPAYKQQEILRIRIINAVYGAVEVSTDSGLSWSVVGRVIAPATESLIGYLASGYAPLSTVAATAVHGIRIRVGDLSRAYPNMINILPKEFSQTSKHFGGLVAGDSGIYTNIPAGKAIFRDLSPYAGNPVFLRSANGDLTSLPANYTPKVDDTFVIEVKRPANPLREAIFQNQAHGKVTAIYANGAQQVVTTVIKPVYGTGRFDGTSYTGVGAINTNHTGVITVSTAPVTTSKLMEGVGAERRGGFQIEPAFHNSQTDEAGARSILIVGSPDKKRVPDQEGKPPLFHGYFNLAWSADDPSHSWRAEIQRNNSDRWLPMVKAVGNMPDALKGVTAIRLIRESPGDDQWRRQQVAKAAQAYRVEALSEAKAGRDTIVRGAKTIKIAVTDPRTRFIVFYVNDAFKAMSNTEPYSFTWNTKDSPDGEYVLEARAEDENASPLTSTRQRLWVDNDGRFDK